MTIMDQVRDVVSLSGRQVFGEPYERNGVTVIPAATVMGGGGGGDGGDNAGNTGSGGGVGLTARPAGAFVIKGDDVTWMPAFDLNRVILGAQVVAIIAMLTWRSVAKARARRLGTA